MTAFIKHDGLRIPVSRDTIVDVVMRSGNRMPIGKSEYFGGWLHTRADADIMSYKIVSGKFYEEQQRIQILDYYVKLERQIAYRKQLEDLLTEHKIPYQHIKEPHAKVYNPDWDFIIKYLNSDKGKTDATSMLLQFN